MTALTYIVRPGEANEELRHSLRSVAENWHGISRVTIVGHAPSWVDTSTVEVVEGNQLKDPHRNVYANVFLACTHRGHPEDLVIMNDDFYLLHPTDGEPPMTYRSTLDEHIAGISYGGWWKRSLMATRDWLAPQTPCQGRTLLSYELHRPFPVRAVEMAAVLLYAGGLSIKNPPQWRTLYGNYQQVPAIRVKDVKAYDYWTTDGLPDDVTWMSTTDATWLKSHIGADLRARFPDPSPFERTH